MGIQSWRTIKRFPPHPHDEEEISGVGEAVREDIDTGGGEDDVSESDDGGSGARKKAKTSN